jgi:hypothetical protein|tara:strand:- start:5491 stop:5721 length:231 start_codon:yes stop_codon:yes gene_type:complete
MERYIITGAQLGIIEGLIKSGRYSKAIRELRRILDKQFIGNSKNTVEEDVKNLSSNFFNTRDEVYNKKEKQTLQHK